MQDSFLLRSLMFVPSHNLKLLESSIKSEADVLLLDLEDSVQPESNKEVARNNIIKYVNQGRFENYHIFPRVNDRESGQLLLDTQSLTIDGVDGFVYPKAKTSQDIYFFDKLLETIEYEKGFEVGSFKIIPLIETASAVLNAKEIAQASDRVIAIAFGNEDFLSDINGNDDSENLVLQTPRALISIAAHSAGITPIDTVHINVHDLTDLERQLKIAVKLGFQGKLILHPKELSLVHDYFSPSKDEVADAKEVLVSFEKSKREGVGVAILNGKFIGPPIVRQAEKIIEKHNRINRKNEKANNSRR